MIPGPPDPSRRRPIRWRDLPRSDAVEGRFSWVSGGLRVQLVQDDRVAVGERHFLEHRAESPSRDYPLRVKPGSASQTAVLVCMARAAAHGATPVAAFSDP